jgi:polar amino acid transport system substrate-binding protein
MKRCGLILGVIFLVALLAACTHTKQGMRETAGVAVSSIQQRGELVVGTAANMPPLNATTKDGEIIGLDVDLSRLMADAMGVKLRLEKLPFSELLPALQTGRVDMIVSGMTMTPERNLKVAFVGPYFTSGKAVLTKLDKVAAAKEGSDLDSSQMVLTTLKGSTSQYFVETVIPKAKLIKTVDYDEAVSLVDKGQADAMIADYPYCLLTVLRYPEKGFLAVVAPLTYEPLAIALPGNDPHLINWVENFLKLIKGSGKLGVLEDRWFKEGAWISRLP